ncbi:hypothetical protein GCM10018772_27280 [Streptomyces fumanus]|uniref:Uncharacterized protein n=1 Tax=Streptomyces fumanus TaxID=67302 RepID=A0A919ADN9_9ACTN|nr:hypothetical protein GCM10018772_27280 [Streptomyces fumanus]
MDAYRRGVPGRRRPLCPYAKEARKHMRAPIVPSGGLDPLDAAAPRRAAAPVEAVRS